MTKLIAAIFIFAACGIYTTASAQKSAGKDPRFITCYEKGNFNRTPRYAETVVFCKLLDANSLMVKYMSIGVSPQGREIPLIILDKDGLTTPQAIRAKGRSVVLVEAAIHAGEPDGKDAGLMLIRDIAIYHKYPSLLDKVSLLFIPIINVDGHEDFGSFYRINQNGPEEVGARFTAQRLNMNRDFIKADAPETRDFIKLYKSWMPELFMDIHVTNGADFQYVSTYGVDQCGFLNDNLLKWTNDVYEAQFTSKMKASGFPIFPYFEFSSYTNPYAGVLPDNFPPQYSNGYASANNRIGILIENHIYKPYKQRVESSYKAILHTMEIVGENSKDLQKEIAKADDNCSSDNFRKDSLALMFVNDMKDSVLVDFLAWKQITVKSDLSGADWTYSDRTSPIITKMPLFNSYKKSLVIKLPKAYIIPQEQIATRELLDIHGIQYNKLAKDSVMEVETYRFINPKWSEFPYEGRVTLTTDYTTQKEIVRFNKGDLVVNTAQPKVKIIAHMLEPKSPTSLVYWGFYNLYARPSSEFYIRLNYMEVKGREMLARDPALKVEFEKKLSADPAFANDPQARLQFFMNKVRQNVEPNANRYPIGRLL